MDDSKNKTSNNGQTTAKDDAYNGTDGQLTNQELQQDQGFMNRLNDNVAEKRDEARAGAEIEEKLQNRPPITKHNLKQLPISEDEAKQLLADETDKLEQNLKNANQKPHKTITLVMIVAVIICVVGAVLTVVLGSMNKSDDAAKNGDTSRTQPASQAPAEETGVVALGLDNPMVQKLYHNFDAVGKSYTGTMSFYSEGNLAKSDIGKELMLAIALRASKVQDYCKGSSDYAIASTLYDPNQDCYDADIVRLKVNEIFGQKVELIDGDWAGKVSCSWQYNSQNNEFYVPETGCGGTCFLTLNRVLDGAERQGDQIYLYETVYGESCNGIYHANGSVIVENEYDENGVLVGGLKQPEDYKDQFDHYKWTFKKNADGFYVFQGLERASQN